MMRVDFVKMHGLGNDFILVDARERPFSPAPEQVRALADRHLGVGFDQLLVVEPARRPEADFRYRIYNADGAEAEHCGNGARCFARYLYERGVAERGPMVLETANGLIRVEHLAGERYRVDMGTPELEPDAIPFRAAARARSYLVEVDGTEHRIGAVSVGNPHAVLLVEDVERAPVATLGPRLERHPRFPQRTNVGFAQVVDRGNLRLRVWERGVGETSACGTGACAAAVHARLCGHTDERLTVHLRGGALEIEWPGENRPLRMTGPTAHVFEGTIDL